MVDRFGGSTASEGDDIARLIFDIADVDVNEIKADFFKLAGNGFVHFGEEGLAVLVDLLDLHCGNNGTHLTENDVLRLVFNLRAGESKQTNGRVLHDALGVGNCGGNGGRDGYADIFLRERVLQIDWNHERFEIEIGKILEQRPDESRAAVDTFGRTTAGLAIDHQNFI